MCCLGSDLFWLEIEKFGSCFVACFARFTWLYTICECKREKKTHTAETLSSRKHSTRDQHFSLNIFPSSGRHWWLSLRALIGMHSSKSHHQWRKNQNKVEDYMHKSFLVIALRYPTAVVSALESGFRRGSDSSELFFSPTNDSPGFKPWFKNCCHLSGTSGNFKCSQIQSDGLKWFPP